MVLRVQEILRVPLAAAESGEEMNDPVEDEGLPSLPPVPRVGYQTGRGIEGGYWRNFSCYELEVQALNAKPKTMRRWAEESAV